MRQYAAEKLDTNDLNDEQSRLYELRNNLGTILARLRNAVTLTLTPEQFDASVARIVSTIRGR
jgi:hypothetical protein